MTEETNETASDPVETTDAVEATDAAEATEPAEAPAEEAADPVETAEEAGKPVQATDSVEDAAPAEEIAPAEDMEEDWEDVQPPPPDDVVPEAPEIEEEKDGFEVSSAALKNVSAYYEPNNEAATPDVPDFSQYKTNVAERLWRAEQTAVEAEVASSTDLVKRCQRYQEWRTQMSLLNQYILQYSHAMKQVAEKRDQLFKQYALLSKETPLWDHIGKPLSEEQKAEFKESGDVETLEGIEERTKTIMKVADEIGPGSLMQHQELAIVQEQMNVIDYKSHNTRYIDEWERVVTAKLDEDVKNIRECSKVKDHYVEKVDKLREKVNKIKLDAPQKLTEQLARNEKKLADADALYEKKAKEISVLLYEATDRGWVDLYPVIKNVMKFEINRLGRESACYGSFHSTLSALKEDYKDATQGTPDAPNAGSAL